MAMIYNNDPMADMPQQGLTFDLLKRFGHADTVSIPSHVTYNATAYEWPALDFNERLAEYESYLGAVEGYCGLRLPLLAEHPDAIVPSSLRNPAFALSRLPGRDHLGRLDKTGARLLSQPIPFAEIRYTNERTLFYPERFLIPLVSDGIMTAVVWRQDLWYQDLLLRTNESFSFIRNPRRVSGQATVLTNAIWQATNLLQLSES